MRRDGSRLLFLTILMVPLACDTGDSEGEDGGLVISTGLSTGGETGDGGAEGGDSSGDTGTGGDTGSSGTTGGDTGTTGGDTGTTGGDTGTTGGDSGTTGGDAGTTGGDSGSTGGDSGTTGGDSGTTGSPNPDNLPAWCEPTLDWNPQWVAWEEEVLVIMNQRRAEGANCGSEGSFPPAGPLTMQANLSCAARMHSKDMYDRDFFDHTNPDGDGPGDRVGYSGYDHWGWGENIAWGYNSPAAVMQGWMDSDGHCSNIMNGDFTEVGVGWYTGDQWTQVFGTPAG